MLKNLEQERDHIAHAVALWRYGCILVAALMVVFGISCIVGWVAHIDDLIRYSDNTRAIVFNNALCFVTFGAAIIFRVHNRSYLSALCIMFVLVVAVLTCMEYYFHVDLGIDQLFFNHYDSTFNPYPGRMHLNSAIFFIVSSVLMLVLSAKNQYNFFVVISMALSMIILTLLAVLLAGYSSIFSVGHYSVNGLYMSSTAIVGFMLLSINLIFMSAYVGAAKHIEFLKYLPLLFSLCLFIAAILLSNKIKEQEIINNYSSILPSVALIMGTIIAVIFGILLYAAIAAFKNYRNAHHSLSVMRTILESTADGILVIDLDGNVVACNTLFLKMLNLSYKNDIILNRGSLTKILIPMLANKQEYFRKRKILAQNLNYDGIDEIKFKNGNIYERHVRPHFLDGRLIGRVFNYKDVTLQRRLEMQLMRQSTYDMLTALPNRALMFDLINRAIVSVRASFNKVALFLIGIDNFSIINDSFGRSKADELLKMIADRLNKIMTTDSVLGRLGGDEFVILHPGLKKTELSLLMINKIVSVFNDKFEFYGNLLQITVCIGIALSPDDGKDADTLLANAHIAMMRAKGDGRNTFAFFTEEMSRATINNIMMQAQLRDAIAENKLLLEYQAFFDLQTNKPVGVEALVRLVNADGVVIHPLDFIPLAEDIGLISPIGDMVIQQVCKQVRCWNDLGLKDLKVAINVSAYQLKNGRILKTIKDAVAANGIDPKQLEIELTEGIFISESPDIAQNLTGLTDLGLGIVLDDFGTGYSSFSYVKKFNISKIKIDQSFVIGALYNKEDRIIAGAMIAMGLNLKFKVLAEGIETKEHLDLMRSMGCKEGQGFYLAMPLAADKCTRLLKSYLQ